jgi:ABC-type sugar transport system permease subunit
MFRVFDIPFILGGPAGAPLGTTDVVSLVIYRQAFGISSIVRTVISQGLAVAGGVVLFIFLLIAVSVQVVVLRRRELSI